MDYRAFFNRVMPLGGNVGCQQTVTIGLSTTPTSIDVRALFGQVDNGEGLLLKADGGTPAPSGPAWRAYFSFTDKGTTLAETAPFGSASGAQAWPLTDGQEMLAHLTSGRAVATGFATGLTYPVLNAKCSFGSGMLKLMRHAMIEPNDASKYQAPVPSWPTAAASGLSYPSGGWNPRP